MVATTKDELLASSEKEFSKLEKLIGPVTPEQALTKDAEDTSIKDVIAHRAHWIGLFLGWYADGMAGRKVHFPAEGYKWNELKRYNAALRDRQKNMGWVAAISALQLRNQDLTTFIEGHSNDALYGGPMKGARNNWTPGRWAEAAGPSHYRSAAKYIRARLKTM